MSEEPLDLQRGEAIGRHIAARQRLQDLTAQLDRTLTTLRTVTQALEGGRVRDVRRNTVVIEDGIKGGMAVELNWPGAMDIGDIVRARRETEAELENLATRFGELGMGEYLSA